MPTAYVVWVLFTNNLHFVSRLAWLHQKVWPEHKPYCNARGSWVPQRNEWPQSVALPLVPVSCSSWRGELGLAQTRSAAPALTAVCSNLWRGQVANLFYCLDVTPFSLLLSTEIRHSEEYPSSQKSLLSFYWTPVYFPAQHSFTVYLYPEVCFYRLKERKYCCWL